MTLHLTVWEAVNVLKGDRMKAVRQQSHTIHHNPHTLQAGADTGYWNDFAKSTRADNDGGRGGTKLHDQYPRVSSGTSPSVVITKLKLDVTFSFWNRVLHRGRSLKSSGNCLQWSWWCTLDTWAGDNWQWRILVTEKGQHSCSPLVALMLTWMTPHVTHLHLLRPIPLLAIPPAFCFGNPSCSPHMPRQAAGKGLAESRSLGPYLPPCALGTPREVISITGLLLSVHFAVGGLQTWNTLPWYVLLMSDRAGVRSRQLETSLHQTS